MMPTGPDTSSSWQNDSEQSSVHKMCCWNIHGNRVEYKYINRKIFANYRQKYRSGVSPMSIKSMAE